MILKRLIIENFKSFQGRHEIDFDRRPGLYLVTGRNDKWPRLGANGIGKTSLFDAIHWCLFGKTARGAKAANVKTWGAKGPTSVMCVFSDIGIVKRTQSPNSIRIDDEDVDQDAVEARIGIDSPAFLHSILLPQATGSRSSFLDMDSGKRLAVVSEVLGLDKWLQHSNDAAKLLAGTDAEISMHGREVARYDASVEEIESNIDAHQKALSKQRSDSENAREMMKTSLKNSRDRLVILERSVAVKKESVDKAKADEAKLVKDVDAARKAFTVVTEQQLHARAAHAALSKTVKELRGEIANARKLSGKCPVCYTKITKDHVHDVIAGLSVRLAEAESGAAAAAVRERAFDEDSMAASTKLKGLEAKARSIYTDIRDKQNEINEALSDVSSCKATIALTEQKLMDLGSLEKTHLGILEAAKVRLKEFQAKLAKARKTLEDAEAERTAIEFWVKGFKEIRLLAVEEALSVLHAEVDSCLAQLGLVDWEMTFDIEKENKSGTFSTGFHTMITSPDNPEPAVWEAWSGGETQRLRMAATMAMSSVVLAGLGVNTNIEVWDEPCEHLSEEGIDDLLDVLHSRAQALGRQIWLIEHRALDYGFDGVLHITRSKKGVEIVEKTMGGE